MQRVEASAAIDLTVEGHAEREIKQVPCSSRIEVRETGRGQRPTGRIIDIVRLWVADVPSRAIARAVPQNPGAGSAIENVDAGEDTGDVRLQPDEAIAQIEAQQRDIRNLRPLQNVSPVIADHHTIQRGIDREGVIARRIPVSAKQTEVARRRDRELIRGRATDQATESADDRRVGAIAVAHRRPIHAPGARHINAKDIAAVAGDRINPVEVAADSQ